VTVPETEDAALVEWALDTTARLISRRHISKGMGERLATAFLQAQEAGDGRRVAWIADHLDQGYRLFSLTEHWEGLVPEKAPTGRLLAVSRLRDGLEQPQ
jgi:hypothetical protein